MQNGKRSVTVAGHAGNPLTLARTRSPTFHWRWAAAAATALLAPFLRLGAIGWNRCRYDQMRGQGSDDVNWIEYRNWSMMARIDTVLNLPMELAGIETRRIGEEKRGVGRRDRVCEWNPNLEREREILWNGTQVVFRDMSWLGERTRVPQEHGLLVYAEVG